MTALTEQNKKLATRDEDKSGFVENIAEFAKWKECVLGSKIPVVVDFWAPWCGPCEWVVPAFEDLSEEYTGKVKFVKVNVDDGRQIASSMSVTSVPTFVFFDKGKALHRYIGVLSKPVIKKIIKESFQDIN